MAANRLRGEYIWIDGFGNLRSKTRIVSSTFTADKLFGDWGNPEPTSKIFEAFEPWNFDGSSTGQATTESSEVHLKPIRIVPDPFRPAREREHHGLYSFLVLCETFIDADCTNPHPTNTRARCVEVMNKYTKDQPMFGLEQEFFMIDLRTGMPLTFDSISGILSPKLLETASNRFYCGIGAGRVSARGLLDNIVEKALEIGLNITGTNYEVAPGQAEVQICEEGIQAADGLVLLRYLLMRGMEDARIRIDFSAKPLRGDWNGSGCHTNFSTIGMRAPGGYESAILPAMKRLEDKHQEHIDCYGKDNHERLLGTHETSSIDHFTWGVAHRGASIRIPSLVAKEGRGYFEDRRPSSSMDPYLVTARLVETICETS